MGSPTTKVTVVEDPFAEMWFVLSGTWPKLGGGQGLKLGKDKLKALIKKYEGHITPGFLGLTNTLVVGENPGEKMVLEAYERSLGSSTTISSSASFTEFFSLTI
jgi:hypothetical protein